MKKYKVTFSPENKSIEIEGGKTIFAAAILAGIHINSDCGGDGVCGKCRVIVKKGKIKSKPFGLIKAAEKRKGIHLACTTKIESDLDVEIPASSKSDLNKKQQDERLKQMYSEAEDIVSIPSIAEKDHLFKDAPLLRKLYLEIDPPTLDDKASDLERLYRAISKKYGISPVHTNLNNIKRLGDLLRKSNWKVTVALARRESSCEVLFIQPGDTSAKLYGLAFDIGTTTISGQLIDLKNNKILGTKATYNKQITFGSDIITRIVYAKKEEGLNKLHKAVVDGINEMIAELSNEHNVDTEDILCMLTSGNTTMIHLLLQIDPSFIRREPYVPTANFIPVIRAHEAGIKINEKGLLYCIPGVASYLGGDITSGALACEMDKIEDLSLLIDIGTNGEIVLGNSEFLIGAAASAGPAFEGSGLKCGMRAADGAIESVEIDNKSFNVKYSTIGKDKARGICGSGYISILSELLKSQIIDKNGKITDSDNKRIRSADQGREFVIAFKEDINLSTDIVITEPDIENLKRAKGAIYAAAAVLVSHMGFNFSDIKKFFIAGGFGRYIDVDKAITIGLLPALDKEKFIFVGNSSLAGARQSLISNDALKKASDIAGKITYFELSVDSKYMEEYMASLFFPHTDLSRFKR